MLIAIIIIFVLCWAPTLVDNVLEKAKAEGAGATVYKGRLVDIASIKQAEVIVKQAEMIAG